MATEDSQTSTKGNATIETAPETAPTPALPDYLASPNAVFQDEGVQWRYGRTPDYSKTRKVWEEGKRMNHVAGSLEEMVENLVKNWEVEASFKPRLSDWRTIDHEKYSFAMGGGQPQSAEHMIKVGTYNGIIAPNEYYSPENSDFASSHKTFKRMMPTFAWEVLEVYSGPPRVAFRWRHWGYMKNDYVGFNDKGEKVTAKAHGGIIDIEGVTVAEVDDKVRLQAIQTWMDPLEMFRQIAPKGVVKKTAMNRNVDMETALDDPPVNDGNIIAEQHNGSDGSHANEPAPEEIIPKHISSSTGLPADTPVPHQGTSLPQPVEVDAAHGGENSHGPSNGAQAIVETAAIQGAAMDIDNPQSNYHKVAQQLPSLELPHSEHLPDATETSTPLDQTSATNKPDEHATLEERVSKAPKHSHAGLDESKSTTDPTAIAHDAVDEHLERPSSQVHPQPKDAEDQVSPAAGEAVVAAPDSEETRLTHEEMSHMSPSECPFLMNRE